MSLSVIWATIKGWCCPGTSVFEEIAKLALVKVNGVLAPVAVKIEKACAVASWALQLVDKYAHKCPDSWRPQFDKIRSTIAQIVTVLEDGTISTDESKKLIDAFRIEYATWFAD